MITNILTRLVSSIESGRSVQAVLLPPIATHSLTTPNIQEAAICNHLNTIMPTERWKRFKY